MEYLAQPWCSTKYKPYVCRL